MLTVDEVQQLLRLRRKQTVYDWIAAGRIPARKVGKSWLISRTEIERMLDPEPGSPMAGEGDDSGGLWDPSQGAVLRQQHA